MRYYRGRRTPNRRGGGSIIGSVIAFIVIINIFGVLGGVFGLVGGIIGLIAPLLPIFIIIYIIWSFTKTQGGQKKTSTVRRNTAKDSALSSKERDRINDRLKDFFKDNYRLAVYDDIYLVAKGGNYKDISDLVINKGDEYIMSLDEFKDRFPTTADDILRLLAAFASKKEEAPKAEARPQPKELSLAQRFIEDIDSLNVDIQKEEIKSGLYQTCALLKQIDISAQEEDDDKIRKLYDYYLPILVKILTNYKSLSAVSKESEEFKESEDQLIKTIVLINEALKTINESLHEDDYMDLSADISTLQSLLKKDGLVKTGTIYEGKEDDKVR